MGLKFLTVLLLMCVAAHGLQVSPNPTEITPAASKRAGYPAGAAGEDEDFEEDDGLARLDDDYDETYASEFPYGKEMGKYKKVGRQARAHRVRIIHRTAKPRNYAKKYQTWAPSKAYLKPKHRPVGPKKLRSPPKRRPGNRGDNFPPNRRRKMPPPRGNQLRRPKPPPEPDYDYLEEEYFPEESKRNEYTTTGSKRTQKPRRPPGSGHRVSSHEHRNQDDYPSISYMNFVHTPQDDYNDIPEEETTRQPDRRRKKKRKKGEQNRNHIRGADQFGATSESIEEHQRYEQYPPYAEEEAPLRRPVRRPAVATATSPHTTPVYGEGYIGHQQRPPQNIKIHGGNAPYNDPNSVGVQTFQNQQYESPNTQSSYGNNFKAYNQPPIQQQYNPPPQQQYNGYASQNYQDDSFSPSTYNSQQQPQGFQRQPKPTYDRPSATRAPSGYTTRANEYSSKYKSSSFFDNTDTFQHFNQNADYQQNTGRNGNQFVPSAEYPEQDNSDADFLNRHLELYSNGMSGVPVQGGQSSAGRAKDYDIGYGEIHYDETHRN